MDIPQYLEKHSLSQAEFGKRVGVSQGMVWQWLKGKRPISPTSAIQIERATSGEIARADLRPDLWADQPPAITPDQVQAA